MQAAQGFTGQLDAHRRLEVGGTILQWKRGREPGSRRQGQAGEFRPSNRSSRPEGSRCTPLLADVSPRIVARTWPPHCCCSLPCDGLGDGSCERDMRREVETDHDGEVAAVDIDSRCRASRHR